MTHEQIERVITQLERINKSLLILADIRLVLWVLVINAFILALLTHH